MYEVQELFTTKLYISKIVSFKYVTKMGKLLLSSNGVLWLENLCLKKLSLPTNFVSLQIW